MSHNLNQSDHSSLGVKKWISYEYQRGPDGRNYAVGGHVDIDLSEEDTPEKTINKMRQVQRAALAPAEPSGADRAVASAAASKEQQAQAELAEARQTQAAEGRKKGKAVREATKKDGESSAQSASSSTTEAQIQSGSSSNEVQAPTPEAP